LKKDRKLNKEEVQRRTVLKGAAGLLGLGAAQLAAPKMVAAAPPQAAAKRPAAKEIMKITKLETFLVKPRWLFLKVHTNAGITGLGEPITEGRAKTCAEAVKEIEPYLVGKDPRAVARAFLRTLR
jgi:galactonate dehydratase